MASIGTYSTSTCNQEILSEIVENGEGIREIIDMLASWGGSSGTSSNSHVIFRKFLNTMLEND